MIRGECWKLAISLVRLVVYSGPNSAFVVRAQSDNYEQRWRILLLDVPSYACP